MGKEKKAKEKKLTVKEKFFMDYAAEIDLFDLQRSCPEWVYDYREGILNKVSKDFRLLCQMLKDSGVVFKVKYPIEVDGKWKFADAFIPKSHIVILLIQDHETIGLPCHSKTDREIFFGDRYKVVDVCTYEIHKVLEKLDIKTKEKPKSFIAYTDGSSDNKNPMRPSGAAYVILDEKGKELHRASKGLMGKTNNFMEMLAIISAVNWVPEGASVLVYSDSEYAIKVFNGQYKAKKNLNLVDRYRQVSAGKQVRFEWVKGHSGNYWNELCDKMANEEYQKLK